MNKTLKLYGVIFIILLLILAVLELSKTEITDWRKNFDPTSKSPFGLFVFDQEAKHLFNNKLVKEKENPYQYYTNYKNKKNHNILLINKEVDVQSWRKIFAQVSKGSDVLIISDDIYGKIADTLELVNAMNANFDNQNVLKLLDSQLKKDSVVIDKQPGRTAFKSINKNGEILGTLEGKEKGNKAAAFVKYSFGKGNVFIHTEPLFITNYYLLKKGNDEYAKAVFSYLPDRETIWFSNSTEVVSDSVLRFILSKPALKYAWWLFLGGVLLFMIFNAKRKQRIVPIIVPLKNTSVEFVKSIGNLYLQEGDFHDMMQKKAQYFLHRVRLELLLDTQELNEDFERKLQLKTGVEIKIIQEAIELIKKGMDPYSSVMKEDLIRLNEILDQIIN